MTARASENKRGEVVKKKNEFHAKRRLLIN